MVAVDYRNADGSVGRFCGNGTRCAARFAVLSGLAPENLVVRTGWGDVPARVEGARVTLSLPEPVAVGRAVSSLDATGDPASATAYALTVGVPHVVAFVGDGVDVATLDLARFGPALRRHPDLREGANANVVEVLGPVASPREDVGARRRGRDARVRLGRRRDGRDGLRPRPRPPPVALETRSGETLRVDFRFEGEVARDVTLAGDARVVFEGTLDLGRVGGDASVAGESVEARRDGV